jgi:hypothetical protein
MIVSQLSLPRLSSLSTCLCVLLSSPLNRPLSLSLSLSLSLICVFSVSLKRPSLKTHLQVKKRKPISETPSFPGNLCKNACLFSFQDSPDLRKSPIFDFSSPAKSPYRSPNALQIPARTAALLLEATMQMVGERVLLESAGRWHLLDGERWENEFGWAERVREVCMRRREERDVCFF